ncbi:MAG: glycosyltransferase family A protein [Treponema sp.]
MALLTIFTPTFNRKDTLKACYESLKNQDFLDFEWCVIDDGSSDDTESLIKSFQAESPFKIQYQYQENQGKHIAWNNTLSMCETEFFMCLDSDDYLISNSLGSVCATGGYLDGIRNDDKVIGLRMNAINSKTNLPCSEYISDKPILKSWFYEVAHEKYVGEKLDIFKTKILQKFYFPNKEGVKFIPESWMYSSVACSGYLFLYLPIAIRFFNFYGDDKKLSATPIMKHAEGHYIYRAHLLKVTKKAVWIINPIYYLKTLIRFSQTARACSKTFKERLKDSNDIFATILSYILGVINI